MSKNLALFLDGTWNTTQDNTNVWRLRSLTHSVIQGGPEQLVYYDTGLGTQFGEKFRGGMFGRGISDNVTQAYEWIVNNYSDGDNIFIFGFSRGAYTARSLAGFISMCGLLEPGAPLGVGQLYRRYRMGGKARTIWKLFDDREKGASPPKGLEEEWVLKYSRRTPIKFVGVWDTVGSLGLPGLLARFSKANYKFLHTGLRTPVEHGFHALAIDEHRANFLPTLWTKRTPKDPTEVTAKPRDISSVEQRWFVGAHGNVGGGYDSDLLAQIPLAWMARKAAGLGLRFRSQVALDGDVLAAPIADSYAGFMGGAYRFLKCRSYRAIGKDPWDEGDAWHNNVNETIDASVFERWRSAGYRPRNLKDWATRKGVDPAQLSMTVRADSPTTQVIE